MIPKINRAHWNLPWMSCILKFRSLKISLETLERSFHHGEKTEISREASWDIWNSPLFVKDLINSRTPTCTYFNVVRPSFQDCFSAVFDNICMERAWMRESLFNMENGELRFFWGRGGAKILGVWVWGALKNRSEVKGEGVKSDYKTKGLNPWARLGVFAEILAP